MKQITGIILAASSVLGVTSVLADAPAVDAAALSSAQVQPSQVEHHWYDGPITTGNAVATVNTTPVASSSEGQSELALPAVSAAQAGSGVSPTLTATDAVVLPQPPAKALPPVESLTDTTLAEATPPPSANIQPVNQTYSQHSSSWPSRQAAAHQAASYQAVNTASETNLQQQVRRLNQQLQNLIAMNLPQQVADMQQQIQQLTGLLEEEQHEIAELKDQQKVFYKDLDARISNAQSPHANTASTVSSGSVETPVATTELTDVAQYQKASELLSQKHYDQAATAYQDYLKRFPKGQFVANAHYWLGELNLLKKNTSVALTEFNAVVKQFPASSKRPDAEYKIAWIQMSSGHTADAKQGFEAIQQRYPKTTAAQLAAIQLKKIAVTQSG